MARHWNRGVGIALVGSRLAMPGALAAQARPARTGLWAGGALGYGYMDFSCRHCSSAGGSGAPHLLLRAGTTVHPTFLLGAELDVWKRGASEDQALQFGPVGYWYPGRYGRLFIKGGMGISKFRRAYASDNPDEVGSGVAFIAGAGVDLRLGRTTWLVPTLTLTHERIGDISRAGLPSRTNVHVTVAALGLGITWHQ